MPSSPMIGNRKSKIYHRPDRPGYDQVSSENRVPFMNEQEAQAGGKKWRGMVGRKLAVEQEHHKRRR